jgi:hypothetical protein
MVAMSNLFTLPKMAPPASDQELRDRCNELKDALIKGHMDEGMAEIVSAHTRLILRYYEDVKRHACISFDSASKVACIGFYVFIGTLICTLLLDFISRTFEMHGVLLTVAILGTVSGALIEVIAGVTFWLYSRVARQFNAFHICLERTHRYLLAYVIANHVKDNRDQSLVDLLKIMANAPMIPLEK